MIHTFGVSKIVTPIVINGYSDLLNRKEKVLISKGLNNTSTL
jgi:hypothetical protein